MEMIQTNFEINEKVKIYFDAKFICDGKVVGIKIDSSRIYYDIETDTKKDIPKIFHNLESACIKKT